MAAAPVAFGRRPPGSIPGSPAGAFEPVRPEPVGLDGLTDRARAFAAQIAAERMAEGRPVVAELRDWKRAHRNRMWTAAGPWKYWACILGVLSLMGRVHDFGGMTQSLTLALRAGGIACGIMATWCGLKPKPPQSAPV